MMQQPVIYSAILLIQPATAICVASAIILGTRAHGSCESSIVTD